MECRRKAWREQRCWKERERRGEKGGERSTERRMAAATVTMPQLVDNPGVRSAIWQYLGLKTNEQGEAINVMHHCVNGVLKHAWLRAEAPPT